MAEEKVTPVTEDEIDDIRVTLELDDGPVECKIATIFDIGEQSYIILDPLDKNGNEIPDGEYLPYRYFEDENGIPSIDNITTEEEFEKVIERFDELLDEQFFNEALED